MKSNLFALLFIAFGLCGFSQGVSVQLLSDPAPDTDGKVRVCSGTNIEFTAVVDYGTSGGSDETTEFAWSFGENVSSGVLNFPQREFLFAYEAGIIINLNILETVSGNTASTSMSIEVPGEPDISDLFTDNPGAVLLGEQIDLNASAVPSEPGYVAPFNGSYFASGMYLFTTFLPDGSGASYESSIEISGAGAGATISSGDDIAEIWSTLEHSYLGDLDIEVECPNGTQITLQEQDGGSCNLGFPWATSPVDGSSSNITPGQGFLYSWSMDGEISLDEGCVDGFEFISGDGPNIYMDSQAQSGTYAPAEDFEGLAGCPVNGEWIMIFTDNIGADNGYSFGWGVTFSSELLPPDSLYEVAPIDISWEENPTIVGGAGGNVTVEPVETGIIDMELLVIDEVGCEYRIPYPIDVYDPLSVEELDDIPFQIVISDKTVTVRSDCEEIHQLDVMDVRGAMTSSERFIGQINVHLPQSGVYMLRMTDSQGETSTRRIMVQ
ncbi:MAG: hypothetical protein HKO93_00960 [Flavobacteriales bacterium]|nr:hypothetical protein [Flavobacteriales bacterium]